MGIVVTDHFRDMLEELIKHHYMWISKLHIILYRMKCFVNSGSNTPVTVDTTDFGSIPTPEHNKCRLQ